MDILDILFFHSSFSCDLSYGQKMSEVISHLPDLPGHNFMTGVTVHTVHRSLPAFSLQDNLPPMFGARSTSGLSAFRLLLRLQERPPLLPCRQWHEAPREDENSWGFSVSQLENWLTSSIPIRTFGRFNGSIPISR